MQPISPPSWPPCHDCAPPAPAPPRIISRFETSAEAWQVANYNAILFKAPPRERQDATDAEGCLNNYSEQRMSTPRLHDEPAGEPMTLWIAT